MVTCNLQTPMPRQAGVLVWPFLRQIERFRTISFPLQHGQAWTLQLLPLTASHRDKNTLRRRLMAWTIMSFARSFAATAFEVLHWSGQTGIACQLSSFLATRSCSFPLQRLSRLRSGNLGSCICLQMYSITSRIAAKAAPAGQQALLLREQRPFASLVRIFEYQVLIGCASRHLLCPQLPAKALIAEI